MSAAGVAWRGLELAALAGLGAGLWLVYQESRAARLERIRRAQYDEIDIYEARLILYAVETLGECQPCREMLDRVRERSKRWAPAPDGYERDGPTLRKL